MSDVMTASEAKQIMDLLQSIDKKLDVHIAKTEGQFNEVKGEIKALDTKVMLYALNSEMTLTSFGLSNALPRGGYGPSLWAW